MTTLPFLRVSPLQILPVQISPQTLTLHLNNVYFTPAIYLQHHCTLRSRRCLGEVGVLLCNAPALRLSRITLARATHFCPAKRHHLVYKH